MPATTRYMCRDALKPRWFHRYPSASLGYVDVETEAVQVRQYCALNMPGLLQTEPYARSVLTSSPLPRTRKAFEDQVAVRMIRQRRLTDEDDPLELVAVVEEAALHQRIGGVEVMRGQLEHLIEAVALPSVTLQVLPARHSSRSAIDGGFNLLSFPEDYNPELLYVEYVTGSLHIEEIEPVQMARLMFDRLRTEALSPTDSVALIDEVCAGLDDQ